MSEIYPAHLPAPPRGHFQAFLTGMVLNRRCTSLASSYTIGVAGLAAAWGLFMTVDDATARSALAAIPWFLWINIVLYPATRELYYRLTLPLRTALRGILAFGLVALIVLALRFAVFGILWAFSCVLGPIAAIYLGLLEALGRGYRIIDGV